MSTPVSIVYPDQTGDTSDYNIPFDYLSQAYVKATVDGVDASFTFLSTYTIQMDANPVGDLRIYRETPSGALINVYSDGSILIDDDLNSSFWQSLHVAEEVADKLMEKEGTGHWDAKALRVTNVSDPTDPQDAATKNWAETAMSSQLAIAAGHASAALSHKNDAASAKTAAEAARDTALGYRDTVAADKAIVAADKTTVAADKALVAADKATVATDKAAVTADRATVITARDTVAADKAAVSADKATVSADKDAVAADRVTVAADKAAAEGFKNAAETARDEAVSAAAALGAVRINGSGEVEFEVSGVVVAKIDASGNFLVAGDIGVQQTL